MIISDSPSPNFGPRAAGKKIKYLILHYSGTQNAFDGLKVWQSPEGKLSAHYFVDEDGSTLRLVPEEMRAWHAGLSSWEGETDINSCSIGIEIQNPGHEFGYRPFPDDQMRAVAELCRGIIERHDILPCHVIAHSDIAPTRKKDPGELFPWQNLAAQGVGVWPQVTEADELAAEQILRDTEAVKSHLTRYGYDNRLELPVLISAFQRHFVTEGFVDGAEQTINLVTVQRLIALCRQKLAGRRKI